ncbi:iron ABC transporter permease [Egibacter rhizosphaerae]|uniref:Iron ABC transporter permease n=1 Tax=Egibacter rhizosphaerae TaxID=1670831 RepID=A0A411YDJ4_9ACTN|nr:iron ABC transporter permease [Egibacter rhizosphaerae]QBI19281.1 iron ABC transporter permease [Egibacter rhizosphaerae]
MATASAPAPNAPPPGTASAPRDSRESSRRGRPPVALVVPAVLAALAALLPLSYLVLRALDDGGQAVDRLRSAQTVDVLANTLLLTGLVTIGCIAIGVPLAWLVTRTDLPARRTWTVLAALPLVIPSYVASYAFIAAFGPGGVLAELTPVVPPSIYGLPGAVLVLVLVSYPYVLLTVRGALLGADPSLEDASRSLGVSRAATFRRVTLPLLRPAIGAGGLLVALYALSDFGAVSLLRFDSFTRAIYNSYRAGFDRTGAVVLALVLVALTAALLLIEARFRGRARQHRAGSGATRTAHPVRLGRWKWPAVAFVASVVGLALVVPLGVLGYWLARGVAEGEPLRLAGQSWVAAWGSVRAAGLAAVAAAALAIPVAVLSVRYRRGSTILLERATYLGYALPGVVIALALVFFGARWGGPLYQSLAMLVFAYVVLFLPQAVGATRATALQLPPSLEDAARGLGEPAWKVLWRVTIPLLRPGVIAGGALVFLTAMKELPATLLLGPTGGRTLATDVWNATNEAFFARAAAPALLLVLIAGVPMALLLHRRHGLGGFA